MFKKLKDKIAEDLKFSPQRLTQTTSDRTQSNNDENFFSIADDDTGTSTSTLGEFTDVSLQASTPMEPRHRKFSNSSIASDISFLPRYEPSGSLYHMQSDLDVSASEIEDNASTSSQLGHISKEQIHSAFQKAQLRYHKYRGRYTDLANHYKTLEKENTKIKTILVDTQDKAIRRVNELKEQCALEQKAKAHLENALRVELDEKQIKIDTLQTKIKFLQNVDKSEQLIDISDSKIAENSPSTSNSSLSDKQNEYQELTKYLNEARTEIENLNGKLQEMKANAIIFNTKEGDYKQKIHSMEKALQERNTEISQYAEREKENNLKLAQSKMELHAEIHNKDLEIANLKKDLENLKHEMDRNEKNKSSIKLENLQNQNTKLIDKIETLNQKCSNYESELIKIEQYKVEITNLNDAITALKKVNEEVLQKKLQADSDKYNQLKEKYDNKVQEFNNVGIQLRDLEIQFNECETKLNSSIQENENLKLQLTNLQDINASIEDKNKIIENQEKELRKEKKNYEEMLVKIRDDAKKSLLTLESKVKEKFSAEYEEKETNMKREFETKLEKISSSNNSTKKIEIELMETRDLLTKVRSENSHLESELISQKEKYTELENNHLDLINESNQTRKDATILEKENNNQKSRITGLDEDVYALREKISKFEEEKQLNKNELNKFEQQIEHLKNENLNLLGANSREENLNEKFMEKVEEINKMRESIHELELNLLEKDQELQNMRKMHEDELYLKMSEYEVLQTEFSLLQEVSTKQQNENCFLNEEKRNFENEIETLSSSLANLNEKVVVLMQELNLKIEDIKQSKEELEKLKKTNKNLQQKTDDLTNENVRLAENMDNLLEKNSNCGEEILKYTEENLKLRNEVKNLLVAQDNYEITIKKLQEEMRKNEETLKESKTNKNEVEKLEKIIRERDQTLDGFKKENLKFSENLTKSNVEIEKIKKKYEEINKEKNDIFTRLMKMEKDNQRLEDEKTKLSKRVEVFIENQQNKEREIDLLKQSFEGEKIELFKTIENLKQYEVKYQGILDENHNLKEQISKIEELKQKLENLENIEDNFQITSKERDTILKDLENMEKQKNETLSENKKLKQEILDLKVLNEKLKNIDEENTKLLDDISCLQTQVHETISDNQNLTEELSKCQHILKYNDSTTEIADLKNKCQQLLNENAELSERNQQLSLDYKQILHENERNVNEFAELKLKCEVAEVQYNDFDDLKQKYVRENEELKKDLEKVRSDLSHLENEKLNLEKLQSSTLETTENQASSLKNKIKELQNEKSDYESLFNEYKQMKTEINNITQLYDKCLKDKKDIENQLQELERHYNEITHEKQLLKDEIQELKISPLNLTDKNKLDDPETLKTGKNYTNKENCIKEIEGLREKLEQYKSIDKANRSSIEFYESELQKLKVKNEKLCRKLDDTLVTLPVLSTTNDLGDSQAILEYLRNVLFNYMVGKESVVLAKVIAAVCKFNKEQTELIMQKEQQRQTLLGQLFGS